jgi:type IV secretory pathway ATPase VirB11/archaellum biosynthesis ATPase
VSAERFGFLAPLLADPEIEEIIVLGGTRTFVVRNGAKELLPEVADHDGVRRIADQLLAGTGRRLDLADPIVSAQLPDGSRVHITGPPITHPDRLNIQIRKFVVRTARLDRLIELGTLPNSAADLLQSAVRDDRTVLVAGAPGSGKTTLVNCLLGEVPPDRRVVTCEEVFEIQADLPDMTQMQTRNAGLDGGGAVTLRDLVREALRQRPDRIVVGEVRGPEGPLTLLGPGPESAGTFISPQFESAGLGVGWLRVPLRSHPGPARHPAHRWVLRLDRVAESRTRRQLRPQGGRLDHVGSSGGGPGGHPPTDRSHRPAVTAGPLVGTPILGHKARVPLLGPPQPCSYRTRLNSMPGLAKP